MIVNYLNINHQITKTDFEKLKRMVPGSYLSKIDRFHRFQDRLRNLFGLLLLSQAWQSIYCRSLVLERIETSDFNRPYLPGSKADFNISHSGDYVVCILSPDSRVGIDIEYKQNVDLNDFTRTMNQEQWAKINKSRDPFDTFFKYWTMKECVIKADGRGLSIPLTDITFDNHKVSYDGNLWHLQPFQIDANHPGCVASSHEIKDLNLVEVHWKEFLE